MLHEKLRKGTCPIEEKHINCYRDCYGVALVSERKKKKKKLLTVKVHL